MAVKGIKDKFQKDVNAELSEKWDKEMKKRNDYFSSFGITTITFTDNDLKDIKNCFETVKKYLAVRPKETLDLNEEIKRISGL